MSQIRISAKNLGQLALPDFCPRCFWIKQHCAGKLPFMTFPGIFSSIDSYSKRVTQSHHDRYRSIPPWFSELGNGNEILKVPHHSKFQIFDPDTHILLTGVPDEMLRRPDGSLLILDYKTAKCTGNQDRLLPIYQIQLNTYALIADKIGMGVTSMLVLVYYEPQTDLDAASIDAVLLNTGFAMRFASKLLSIELQPERIPPLLERVRAIHDMAAPPPVRQECEDCRLLSHLVRVASA